MQSSKLYIYGLGGKFIPQAIYILTNIVLARLLSPYDFGVIGVLAVFFMIAETMMDAGLGGSLINKKVITKIDCSTVFVFNLTISHLLYIVLFFGSDYIEQYFQINDLSTITRVVGFVFVINSWGLVVNTLLAKELRFKEIMGLSIISGIIASIVSIVFAVCKLGVYSLVAYQLALAISRVIGAYILHPMCLSFKFSIKSFKEIAPFGMYTTFILIIDNIYENILTILYGKYLTLREAGYISQSKRIEESASKTLIATINNVAFPLLSSIKEKTLFIKEANDLYKSICLILFPLLILVSVFSEEVITILLGKEWVDAGLYLSFLIYAGVFMVMEALYRNFIKSLGEVKQLLIYTVYKRIVGFSLIFTALAISIDLVLYLYVVSATVAFLLNLYLFCRLTGERFISHIIRNALYVLPCLVYLFCIVIVEKLGLCQLLFSLLLSVIFMVAYYLLILPKFYNVNVVGYVQRFVKRNK
ncbi:oligosaccharide flippase family protein [uncultured Phocaeicola sp.]|uniref:oligosaccharide flippase family protein n=1 Tax=uncultured Phocaeicola sp. TaxID=990718 RepID=UPI0025F2DDD5|nr:oligosaccharide flippase family protein [uncultured Phocaeicola sp.]